ncbi:hypothetical protein MHYMCMPSP_00310 [Hyalomma marginatum]|uniref:Uncharacterized protein n=1 Tax=Hyalomma marginatum TaxID=34627 RepID=A0A8S4C2W0_9ACAR|nr:hypothetical protein MHYMCMPSP_00310 [Hyalomma marginatum]CAG7594296.1 hypothetical protein MHYMCMPASI_00751 [Hyalomma marginatum]
MNYMIFMLKNSYSNSFSYSRDWMHSSIKIMLFLSFLRKEVMGILMVMQDYFGLLGGKTYSKYTAKPHSVLRRKLNRRFS